MTKTKKPNGIDLGYKDKRYSNDLVIHRYSDGSLVEPAYEKLKEIKETFFKRRPLIIYFYITDWEVRDQMGLGDNVYRETSCTGIPYYQCELRDFVKLIRDVFNDVTSYRNVEEQDIIPIVFSYDRKEIIKTMIHNEIVSQPIKWTWDDGPDWESEFRDPIEDNHIPSRKEKEKETGTADKDEEKLQ
tara:strand:+ start:1228 stop:1788 length:561 start_codon:yes stop_codon:yes gene_type:complete